MVKTYTAQSVGKNHDWDFSCDENGQITKLVVKSEVNYGTMGMTEELDVWPKLNDAIKQAMQDAYDKIANIFNKKYIG